MRMLSIQSVLLSAFLVLALPIVASAESIQITNVSPTGTISPGSSVSFAISSNGFMSQTYALSDTLVGPGSTMGTIDQNGYFTWTPTIYDGGLHTITVTATDVYHHAASSTVSILVASTNVLVKNLKPGPVVTVGKPVSFTAFAPGFITPRYTVYDTAWRSSLTPANVDAAGNFTWTPNADDIGTHMLAIAASDPYGRHADATQNITVVNPTLSVSNLSPGGSASVGSTVSFKATVNALTATTTYAIADSFTGTSTISASSIASTGALSWTPTASDVGRHLLTVTATDSYGNAASTTVPILIVAASSVPTPPVSVVSAPASTSVSPVASSSAPVAAYTFTKTIAAGSRGAAVTALQNRLQALGLYTGPITGYFGPMTVASVKKFQKAHGLAQVGSVGPGTRAILNR